MDISSMLEVQVAEVKEVDSKENVTPKDLNPSVTSVLTPISPEERNFYKLAYGNDLSIVRFRRIHCTACDVHIGSAPAQSHNMLEHPILRTLLCAKCREFYGDGTFDQGDDATDMFCRWCANGGHLYCCSYCSNTFCYKCIKRNFDSLIRKKIEADEKWKCFVCDPRDLYNARALCWALLQHINTITRLLQNDRLLSEKELAKRMNADESECCIRRRKRKRRRTGSNSEDDDETYDPNSNDESMMVKRRSLKRRYKHRRKSISNGTIPPLVPLKQSPVSFNNISNTPEESTSLSSTEQAETGNVNTNSESVNVSSISNEQQNTSLPSRFDSTAIETVNPRVQTTYSSTISAVPTVKLLQSTAPFKPMQSLLTSRIQPKNTCMLTQRFPSKNSYQPAYYSAANQTVAFANLQTIANQKLPITLNRSRFLLPKPRKMVQMMMTPNVINLDSDSDETALTQSTNVASACSMSSNENIGNNNLQSTAVVPVALVSNDNNSKKGQIRINETEHLSPSRKLTVSQNKDETSFSQVVLFPHKTDFNDILCNLQIKFNQLLQDSQNENISRDNIQKARSKIHCLYREICNTVTQLAYINDRIIRKYSSWEKSCDTRNEITQDTISQNSILEENNEIPLDMSCTNDSASDSESENNVTILTPSKFIASTNIFDVLSKQKDTTSQGVGNSSVLCNNKSIQVDTVELRDYEQVIGYSKLTKTDIDSLAEINILEPASGSSKYSGKYQEQFIFYLQYIEDHGIDRDDTFSNDVLQSFIDTEVDICTIDPITEDTSSIISNNANSLCTIEKVSNVQDTELPSVTRIAENLIDNEHVNKVIEKRDVNLVSILRSDKQDLNTKKETLIGIKSVISNEENSNDDFCTIVAEDDCTIIED